MFNEFYHEIASIMVQSKAFKNSGKLSVWGWIKWLLNFIWQISFICSCLLFSYRQFDWSFFNFDVELIFKALVLLSLIAYIALVLVHYGLMKSGGYFRGLKKIGRYAQVIRYLLLSVIIGTISTVAFGVVVSILLMIDKLTMLICVGLCLQIPYFVTYIIYTCFLSTKFGQNETGQINGDTLAEYICKVQKIGSFVLVILELAMLAFVVYFGVIPFCQGGGLNAITEKANEIITVNKDVLFGSGGIVGAAIAGVGLLVKIIGGVRNRRNR